MSKKIRRVCVVDTVYTLLLYYLICGINEEDIFIMSGGIPKEIRKNIKHIYFPHFKNDDIPDSNLILIMLKRLLIIVKRVYGILKVRIMLFFKTRNYDIKVYGQGHTNFSFPLYEYENSYIIEDGLGNYMNLVEPDYSQSRLLKFLGSYTNDIYEGFGTHKNIKKVYLTKNEVPELIKNKVEIINMKKLWDEKTENEKNKILKIFNIEKLVNQLEENPILLLTQCYSEDNLLPYDEEIGIYKYLIEKQENKNIIIKTHPREKKDYSKIFPDIFVIDKPFPLEIFKCIDKNINKIITISSSAALTFKDECEIELYNGKTSSELINSSIMTLKKEIDD